MVPANLWHKFYLYGRQVAVIVLWLAVVQPALAQADEEVFNPRYDERKTVTYGFSIAIHSTSFRIKYSDYFTSPAMDSVYAIMPRKKPGFKLGFIINFKLAQYLDARITPTVSFAEYVMEYTYVGGDRLEELVESTGVQFPLLFKYKSQRRNNLRMYVVGGLTPEIEAAVRSELEEDQNRLKLEKFNTSLEFGFGVDMYYPLFKFSPEIRFSYGLRNILSPVQNDFSAGLADVRTKAVTLYFHFQ